MKGLILVVAFILATIVIGYQYSTIKTLRKTVVTQTAVADSLHDELFNANVINGRYELTLDHLQEVNPKAALEFVNYMNHETE